MVVEKAIPEFLLWVPGALLNWLLVCVVLVGVAVLLGYLVATLRNGPAMAIHKTGRLLRTVPQDLLYTSPRRIWALTRLAVKESIRRRVVVGFAVFIILLLFAGWFLDPRSERPARLYLDFVLSMTGFLVLLMALILSALSLPNDIKYRTIHTVVTKPVRPTEIVLGRILGFTIIGTGMLLVMGLLSYGFVLRGLAHRHTLSGEDLVEVGEGGGESGERKKTGFTSKTRDHRHEVQIAPGGELGQVGLARGHTHELTIERSAGETQYRIGSPEGMLQARVPVYGSLRFRGPKGTDKEKGINVGDEWAYRSYIAGGSDAAAIWTFAGITPDAFPDGLPVEMTLGVFRTYKGDIEKGVLGGLSVRNPRTGLTIEVEIFESVEFSAKRVFIPRKITRFSGAQMIAQRRLLADGTVESSPPLEQLDPSLAQKDEYDLFEDLVSDGTVEVWLQCLESSQYFGAAQADLYLRAKDAWFLANFAKGYLGIWLQMVLVVGFGVMFSTFLSAPVAAFATVGILGGGFFKQFMADLGRGEVIGGGPFEALVRLVRQDNLIVDLNPGLGTKLVEMFDTVAEVLLRAMAAILPPFADFGFNAYVAEGYDISLNALAVRSLSMLAFLVPVLLAGYLFLKTREVSQ